LLVFEVFDGPEAEVHGVKHEKLKQRDLGVWLCLMKMVRVEWSIWKVICNVRYFVLMNDNVLSLINNPLAGLSNKLALIGHLL
jgi:hypothetical protein